MYYKMTVHHETHKLITMLTEQEQAKSLFHTKVVVLMVKIMLV